MQTVNQIDRQRQSDHQSLAPTGSTPPAAPVLQADALTRRVEDATGTLVILDRVSLSLSAGETVAIVGASGSGKSTLLGLLAGLDVPNDGHVQMFGRNLSAMDEDQRAAWRSQHVGFVFQSFQLLPHLTALENVMLPLELAGRDDAQAQAQMMLQRVGLASRVHHYPRTLSGGEQQRVALARAFVAHPPILFADEPTGSLDSATGDQIIDLMFALNREDHATLVLVTHDPALAARCDRQIRLQAGKVV